MITISRFTVPTGSIEQFRAGAETTLAALSSCTGYRHGSLCRAVDDPQVWAIVTGWDSAGSYRRALGAFDVRMALMPLQVHAMDEPGAYEVVARGEAGRIEPVATDLSEDWARDS